MRTLLGTKWLWAVCLLAICQRARAQGFEHLGIENGLSQNSVMYITQDTRGFLWFGTHDGLNRYDGHHFKIYKHDPAAPGSLSTNYITALLAARGGGLWIGTLSGLDWYDPIQDTFRHVMKRDQSFPNSVRYIFNCIFQDKQGNTWVGTSRGLAFIPVGQKRVTRRIFPGGPVSASGLNNIQTIHEDQEGNIWMGTADGLIRMREEADGFYSVIFQHDKNRSSSLSANFVTSIAEDDNHHLWIGTRMGGLNRFDAASGAFMRFSHPTGLIHNDIRQILRDNQGRLWIGTLEGLSILDPEQMTFLNLQHDPEDSKSLSQNSVYSIFQDASGSVWIGTYFGGINVHYAYSTTFLVYHSNRAQGSLNNNVISGIAEGPDHGLWIGTEGGGINWFDREKGVTTVLKNIPGDPASLASNLVKVVYRDREGRMWAGTHGGGLNLFDPGNKRFTHFFYNPEDSAVMPSEIYTVLEDARGLIWIGTQSGLRFLRKTPGGFQSCRPFPLPSELDSVHSIRDIIEDSRGKIWLATSGGLYAYNPTGGRFQFTGNPSTLNCVFEDRQGDIWVGMQDGLGRYHQGAGRWTVYSQKDGLPGNTVLGILGDENGDLWLSTNNGLSRFSPPGGTFKNYTRSDGLAADEFNYGSYYQSGDGELFFGGYNGLTAFYPRQIETNTHIAPMVFTSLSLFSKPVTVGGKDRLLKKDISFTKAITLHYGQNVFTISFALLNYIKPEKNTYAYTLEGFEKDWHTTTLPSVDYMNLPPGDYTFRVRGANNDGVWSPAATLKITVLPPFWATWWAFALYVLFLGAVVFLITRFFFIRALLRKDEALHQAKLNFFTNVSHEIRTRLTLITAPLEQFREDRQIALVKSNADRLLRLVEELMDFRKAETNHLELQVTHQDLVAFAYEVYRQFTEPAATRQIRTDFLPSAEKIPAWFDKAQLEKVLYNLLSNALKFTPDGGYISLTLEQRKEQVDIKVTDNGKGIAPENLPRLFSNFFQVNDYGQQNTGYGIGLALSKSIMQLHKGSLTVSSEQNRTCFTATLLLGHGHFQKEQLRQTPKAPGVAPADAATDGRRPDEMATRSGTVTPSDERPVPVEAAPYGKTILLVEDNAEVRAFITGSLSDRYMVVGRPDGETGWETAISEIPDLIISDVMMPGMDGLELCRKLKEDPRTNHIPVILLTAKASLDHQVSGLQMGADIYLTKPFSVQILHLHIRNLLTAVDTLQRKFNRRFMPGAAPLPLETPPAEPVTDEFLERLIGVIEDNLEDHDFDVPMLCTKVAMSQSVLYKKVKAMTGMTLADLIKSVRFRKAARLLAQKQLSVYEVAYLVGFNDAKYFSREFKKQFGKTPSEYAKEA